MAPSSVPSLNSGRARGQLAVLLVLVVAVGCARGNGAGVSGTQAPPTTGFVDPIAFDELDASPTRPVAAQCAGTFLPGETVQATGAGFRPGGEVRIGVVVAELPETELTRAVAGPDGS